MNIGLSTLGFDSVFLTEDFGVDCVAFIGDCCSEFRGDEVVDEVVDEDGLSVLVSDRAELIGEEIREDVELMDDVGEWIGVRFGELMVERVDFGEGGGGRAEPHEGLFGLIVYLSLTSLTSASTSLVSRMGEQF